MSRPPLSWRGRRYRFELCGVVNTHMRNSSYRHLKMLRRGKSSRAKAQRTTDARSCRFYTVAVRWLATSRGSGCEEKLEARTPSTLGVLVGVVVAMPSAVQPSANMAALVTELN